MPRINPEIIFPAPAPEGARDLHAVPGNVARPKPWLVVVFLLGLVALDQLCLLAGDALTRTPHWGADPYRALDESEWDVAVMGDCHALLLKNAVIGRSPARLINLGTPARSMGRLLFSIESSIARHAGKTLVLVLDERMIRVTPDVIWDEIDEAALWMYRLGPEARARLTEGTGMPLARRLRRQSGIWKYRGRGFTMARATWRMLRGRPADPEPPGGSTFDPKGTMTPEKLVAWEPARATEFVPSRDGIAQLGEAIERARAAGMRIIFVLPPQHRLRATDEVARRVISEIDRLAVRLGIPFINYWNNHGELALRDDWWTDPVHVNDAGAAVVTRLLVESLNQVLR